jgi:hypothetical protein
VLRLTKKYGRHTTGHVVGPATRRDAPWQRSRRPRETSRCLHDMLNCGAAPRVGARHRLASLPRHGGQARDTGRSRPGPRSQDSAKTP